MLVLGTTDHSPFTSLITKYEVGFAIQITQQKYAINLAKSSMSVDTHFFYVKVAQYVPAAVQCQNNFLILTWISTFNHSVEQVQTLFLCYILGPCARAQHLDSTAWLYTLKFWLHPHVRMESPSYIQYMVAYSFTIWMVNKIENSVDW